MNILVDLVKDIRDIIQQEITQVKWTWILKNVNAADSMCNAAQSAGRRIE